jgi:putative ABC transport system substrate-binding protein
MRIGLAGIVFVMSACLATAGFAAPHKDAAKKRIIVVSSYHREYLWSQETNRGFCDAMLKWGYFDNEGQAADYTKNDIVETSKIVVKKFWLDAKRIKSKQGKLYSAARIVNAVREFKPDLIFLGDDDAAQYVGTQFLDTGPPMVFWGINNTPVKYGLVDAAEKPGHNATGIFQPGYYAESLALLKKIVPSAKTFAVLTDDTTAGRSHYKAIEHLAAKGALPLKLVETVVTGDYEVFKSKVLALQTKVDAFFVAQYSSLLDRSGSYVSANAIAAWYLTNSKIPETAEQGQFVRQGMLCGADDSGYNQGFEAVAVARDILFRGANPATYPVRAPKRGALMVNKERAAALGVVLSPDAGIEEYIERAGALHSQP